MFHCVSEFATCGFIDEGKFQNGCVVTGGGSFVTFSSSFPLIFDRLNNSVWISVVEE